MRAGPTRPKKEDGGSGLGLKGKGDRSGCKYSIVKFHNFSKV